MADTDAPITSATKPPAPTQTIQPSNPAAVARNRLHEFLKGRLPSLTQWALGSRSGVDPASLVRFAMMEWSQNEKLQKCSPESIYLALIACAQVGLEPSGVKQEAFIVPYNDRRAGGYIATFQPGWRGLIKLAKRSGEVLAIVPHVVYERDEFELHLGSDARVIHRPCLKSDRGPILGAYALAKMTNGEFEIEWMPLETLERIRTMSQRGEHESPAYREWADQMYRKAPIKRLCKRLPLGEDYFRAAHLDEQVEAGDLRSYQRTIDAESAPLAEIAEAEQAERPALTSDERRGVRGAARALDHRRNLRRASAHAPTEPLPDIDPLQEEIEDIKAGIQSSLTEPARLPGLRERIGKIRGEERLSLDRLLADAESVIARARAEDDVAFDLGGE
jgi:phage RecT family recombinase